MSLVKYGISPSGKQKYFCKKCVKHCSGHNRNILSKNADNYQGISAKDYLKIR
jgi:transposase-like protein